MIPELVLLDVLDGEDYKPSNYQKIINLTLLHNEHIYDVGSGVLYYPETFLGQRRTLTTANVDGLYVTVVLTGNKFYKVHYTMLYHGRQQFEIINEI